jgi:hypothetical protein
MTGIIDIIHRLCDELQRDLAVSHPGLALHFVMHNDGELRDSIALAEHEIIMHPAGEAACNILRRHTKNEKSSFIGLAVAKENKMMGFKQVDHLMALFTLNYSEFDSEESVYAQIYHMIWHAIDLYEIRLEPDYKKKFRSGPMVPKRSPLNLSKANLQADAFAATLSAVKGNKKMLSFIDKKRGLQCLSAASDFKAEDYPSIIALQACKLALDELDPRTIAEIDHIETARQISLDIGQAFDKRNMQEWWDFCIPAQDMAWRDCPKENILGAAMYTSESPFVRSMAYLVQEVTGIKPYFNTDTAGRDYNAFVDPEVNKKLHREVADTIFEEAISKVMLDSSTRALMLAANKQNQNLTDGRFIGWCATALQEAAKAFEKALQTGSNPKQAARMQFEGDRDNTSWDDLQDLSNKVVDQKRQGVAVTMGHIAEICHDNPGFAPVLDSIKITMNDPGYIQALEASNDLAMAPNAPAPQAPAPKGPAPKAPEQELGPKAPMPNIPMPAPSGPSLGGSNRNAQMMRQRQLMAQKAKEAQTNKNTSDETTDA